MEEKETIDMENLIIEAAKTVFVRKGYKATTMSDVAAEVGIGRTALHYYFRTKDILFDAIFDKLLSSLLPNLDKVMDEESTILEKLPSIVDLYLGIVRQNPLFPNFVVSELNRDPEHLVNTLKKTPNRVQPLLRLCQQMEEEMQCGLLRKMPLVDFFTTFASLVVFPFLAKNAMLKVFLNEDEREFDDYLNRRRNTMIEVLTDLMSVGVKR